MWTQHRAASSVPTATAGCVRTVCVQGSGARLHDLYRFLPCKLHFLRPAAAVLCPALTGHCPLLYLVLPSRASVRCPCSGPAPAHPLLTPRQPLRGHDESSDEWYPVGKRCCTYCT